MFLFLWICPVFPQTYAKFEYLCYPVARRFAAWVSERGRTHGGKKLVVSLLVEKVNGQMDPGGVDLSLRRVCWVVSCHGCHGVVPVALRDPRWAHQVGWEGASWVGVGLPRASWGQAGAPGPAPTLHPLGYAGTSSLGHWVLLSRCWEQLAIRERLFFLPPSSQCSQPPR